MKLIEGIIERNMPIVCTPKKWCLCKRNQIIDTIYTPIPASCLHVYIIVPMSLLHIHFLARARGLWLRVREGLGLV